MLGKLWNETYAKVRSRTDAFRQSVSLAQQAMKDALGLESKLVTASELTVALEEQAVHRKSQNELLELYGFWVQRISENCDFYFNDFVSSPEEVELFNSKIYDDSPKTENLGITENNSISASLGESDKKVDEASQIAHIEKDEIKQNSNKDAKDENDGNAEFVTPESVSEAGAKEIENRPNGVNNDSREMTSGSLEVDSDRILSDGSRHRRSTNDGRQFLSFKQVLLQSAAIELSLLTISKSNHLHSVLAGPLDEGEKDTIRDLLLRVLGMCLVGDRKTHVELVTLFCTYNASESSTQLTFLRRLVTILKLNWVDDKLSEMRTNYTTEIHRLNCEIDHIGSEIDAGVYRKSKSLSDDKFKKSDSVASLTERDDTCVAASAQLIRLTKKKLQNLDETLKLRESNSVEVSESLDELLDGISESDNHLVDNIHKAHEEEKQLKEEMQKETERLEIEIGECQKIRDSTTEDHDRLHNERQQLLIQVEILSKQIAELEAARSKLLRNCDILNEEIQSVQKRCKQRIIASQELYQGYEICRGDIQSIKTVTISAKKQILSFVAASTEDASSKSSTLENSVSDLIRRHFVFEKVKLDNSCRFLMNVVDELRKASSALKSKMGRNEGEDEEESFMVELRSVRELRHKLTATLAVLDEHMEDLQLFKNNELRLPSVSDAPHPTTGDIHVLFDEIMKTYSKTRSEIIAQKKDLFDQIERV